MFVSSTSVYENNNCFISESDGLESAQSPWFKIEALLASRQKFKTTIIRFGGLIGYGRNPANFLVKTRVFIIQMLM